jgi:DNA-directed RNA polymerase subunit E'/Rpb7
MSKIQNKKSSFKKTTLDNSHVYIRSLLTQKIVLKYDEVNSELFDILEIKIKKLNEGKCIKEGYVKNNSVKLLTYSSGELFDNKILFECVFECLITNPVESTIIYCITKSITKVGVRAELIVDDEHSPYVVFIARDHHYNNEVFSQIKENDIIQVRILGQRYELNDKFISIIAELISINNYSTLKNELESLDTDENLEKIGGKKLKIKIKKSTQQAIKNLHINEMID